MTCARWTLKSGTNATLILSFTSGSELITSPTELMSLMILLAMK